MKAPTKQRGNMRRAIRQARKLKRHALGLWHLVPVGLIDPKHSPELRT